MSSGISRYYEDLEEQIENDKQAAFAKKSSYEVRSALESIKKDLESFIVSDPSLTKIQWRLIEGALASASKMLK